MTEIHPPAPIRLLSWNLHGFIGRGRAPDLGRTLAAVARLSPDIAALQEVDGRTRLGRGPFAFERLAEGLGYHLAEARTLRGRRPGTDYGHVLWSRWPILEAEMVRLPGGVEPRAAIDARVETPHGPLRILSTHFSLNPRGRRAQARLLAERLAAEPGPALLLGDLNEWRADGAVHRTLSAVLPAFARPRSWPAGRPVAAMDRLYANGGVSLLSGGVDALSVEASDHLPLVCEVTLRGPSSAEATSRRV
ncbi:endonuclease/exonuclease/phosphatase family protein [Antarcticirhabdus aurantiaca]|uniref:endonuclease/exonuclease/phosphatase family protein n=1 Tax=Antarcticirhabdus aurantiaca TaxID=2606717 RepID=UPI00131B2CA3